MSLDSKIDFGLKQQKLESIVKIISQFPEVKEAIIFGSRASGKHRNGSDIDIALKGASLNLTIINKISLLIDDLYLPQMVDLINYDSLRKESLKDNINSGITIYSA